MGARRSCGQYFITIWPSCIDKYLLEIWLFIAKCVCLWSYIYRTSVQKTSAYVYDPTYIGPQYKTNIRKGTIQGFKIWAWQKEKIYKYTVKFSKQYYLYHSHCDSMGTNRWTYGHTDAIYSIIRDKLSLHGSSYCALKWKIDNPGFPPHDDDEIWRMMELYITFLLAKQVYC